jgi:L-ascorbate metabolism protein UlaG (beta-lactamase superfamily)
MKASYIAYAVVATLLVQDSAVARPPNTVKSSIARQSVTFTYFGFAGWQIETGGKVILVDPFLTGVRFRDQANTSAENEDPIIDPDTDEIARHIQKADYVLITHAHVDHALEAPYISNKYGAVIIGHEGTANIAKAYGVADDKLIVVRGGEDFDFGGFSVRVIPSIHSALYGKRYNNSQWAGAPPAGLKAPLHQSAFQEGGTLMYLLRISGHEILIMGGMNYLDRELQGLRPDIAILGAGTSRAENYRNAGRLMDAIGNPPVVLPTHWDSGSRQQNLENVRKFADEIHSVSPKTRVIIPDYFTPIKLP